MKNRGKGSENRKNIPEKITKKHIIGTRECEDITTPADYAHYNNIMKIERGMFPICFVKIYGITIYIEVFCAYFG